MYNNVDWFVEEVMKLKKIAFYVKNTIKYINMTQDDDEQSRNTDTCQFCE